jgi:hypothetical protein
LPAPARSAAPLAFVAFACSSAPVAPASTVQHDPAGPCAHADLATEAARADRSLVVVPYRQSARLYDVNAQGQAVPWQPARTLAPDAEAVLSYPDPLRFAGAPAGFERLAHRSFVYEWLWQYCGACSTAIATPPDGSCAR